MAIPAWCFLLTKYRNGDWGQGTDNTTDTELLCSRWIILKGFAAEYFKLEYSLQTYAHFACLILAGMNVWITFWDEISFYCNFTIYDKQSKTIADNKAEKEMLNHIYKYIYDSATKLKFCPCHLFYFHLQCDGIMQYALVLGVVKERCRQWQMQ